MDLPIKPVHLSLPILLYIIYRYVIHPSFFSPLRSIPSAHWSARFSNLWIQYHRSRSVETFIVHAAHEKLGPIILLGPDCVSVNTVDGGIRTVYSGGWEKDEWYSNVFSNYGVEPMFAMAAHNAHAQRKRMVSNIYAKTTLQNSTALSAITDIVLGDRLLSCLEKGSKSPQTMEIYDLFCAATMDVVSAYVFGLKNSSNFLLHPTLGQNFFRNYKARQNYQFWPQDAPRTTASLAFFGLKWLVVPQWVSKANQDIEDWLMAMCDKAEQSGDDSSSPGSSGTSPEDHPTVYLQTRTALTKVMSAKDDPRELAQRRLAVASEMLDHVLAGFDTSSITLTFLAWELSLPHNAAWQGKLHAELLTLPSPLDAKALDALPILHAILMESLRLHAAIPGNQPRVSPANAVLAGIPGLPAGLRVQAQAWSLHRNATVFPDPNTWRPERWLDTSEAQKREMARWFWAFGSGGRMCVGSNLAMYDMKAIVAGLWRGFRTRLVDGEGMVHSGGYEAGPLGCEGRYCVVKVERREGKGGE